MGPGKIASQAGHAFLGSYLQTLKQNPDAAGLYLADGIGTKVCLAIPNLEWLLLVRDLLLQKDIPFVLIEDSGHKHFFNGKPTITALGVGPAKREEIHKIIGRFKLL